MHVLDVIPDLLKFNIVNDDGSFLPWITLKAIPVIAFYTGIGRFSGEFHPTNNKVRGRLSSKQLSTESEFIKHQLVLASTNKSNIVWQILNAQDRDTAFKNKYHEYELNDISDLYVPKKITAMKPNFQQVKRTDFFFIDNISRRILNINFQVFPSAKKSHRKFLTGKISSHDTFEFNFQSDLNLKSAQMIPFSRDVIQPHIYRQKEVNSSIIKMRNSQMYNIE
ncbi:hypothetical protein SS50377_21080 [Spironucleus salmonicida]|uniref:Uncharacterized protein n=1 Tax=Spironucleus salmonicida TaxID=348837 RepID=V6LJH6_9EUKA|nr:hypothetical protein SS50377_21080 [Spironucleus salmonicida]|eukprot:EST43866.1 Hypothetical protein SS50377_16166 [Spironucleus salmonicida]